MPGGRPTKYDPAMLEAIIACGGEGMSKAEMAVEIGIARSTFDEWENNNPAFSEAVKDAVSRSQAWWERKGRVATFESAGFNATSYIFNMKNRFPSEWRDKTEVDNTHNLADPLTQLLEHVAATGKRIGT